MMRASMLPRAWFPGRTARNGDSFGLAAAIVAMPVYVRPRPTSTISVRPEELDTGNAGNG